MLLTTPLFSMVTHAPWLLLTVLTVVNALVLHGLLLVRLKVEVERILFKKS